MITKRLLSSLILATVATVGMYTGWRQVTGSVSGSRLSNPQGSVTQILAEDTQHELFFAEREVDLGLIKSDVSYDFDYENRGPIPVLITETSPSCSCTVTRPPTQPIQVGEKGCIHLVVHMRPDRIGPQAYSIDVNYKGAEVRQTRLVVRVQFKPDVLVQEAVRAQAITGRLAKASFTLVDLRDAPLEITRISTTSPELNVKIAERPSVYLPGWRYTFNLEWTPQNPNSGTHSESITLYTTDAERPAIVIQAMLEQLRRLRVTPETLHFTGVIPLQKGLRTGIILVSDRDGEPVEIDSVKCFHEGLQCKVHSHQNGGKKIELRLEQQLVSKNTDHIVIQVSVKKPVVEVIPVKVVLGFSSTSASQ